MANPSEPTSNYEFGHATLGPVIASFALLLIREAGRRKLHRLAFVARDGELLWKATQRLLHGLPAQPALDLVYIYLSRQATAPAALDTMDAAAFKAASAVRAGPLTVGKLLEFHGLGGNGLIDQLEKHKLAMDTGISSSSMLSGLFADEGFQAEVATMIAEQKKLLLTYLSQQGIDAGSSTGLVDIGWRGSIQSNLSKVVPGILPGFYFGLWSEGSSPDTLPPTALGLISDQRRGRYLREGAAWHVAHLLEAICRAHEGTTLSYCEMDGRVVPLLAADHIRRAEIASDASANDIRTGILDRIEELARDTSWNCQSDNELRRGAQNSLFKLAFFPSAAAIVVGKSLVHTEGHAGGWSAPLIAPGPYRPFTAPRQWLAGLASPWRSGYVCATGGKGFAWLFLGMEAVLASLPPQMRCLLVNLMRRFAGLLSTRSK
ncbi:hypothetical protein [Candidatus Accumulibacter sp. ACC012]|uniref:hypothetical protein n=1 Tax=Candidatus Accumulibacter sp. ACC012 TaxID=2823332 RepID=UPI0025BE57FD|nr:hypothetical protein [Candidatus Accumulibacter sp. ACC012]